MTRKIEHTPLDQIALDPINPRLGRAAHQLNLDQDQIYDRMKDWSLEELATSFLESGFWPHEAVLCVVEPIQGQDRLVVVEGNRRIAALQRLQKTYAGLETSKRWRDLIEGVPRPDKIFEEVPYIKYQNRAEVDAFLGFRHVTGIKEWAPPEKAQFIAKLIDESGLSYRQVMRKIGSKTDTVERNYIAYCILSQMEETEGLDVEEVENRFSVLFLSLRSKSVQKFLGIENKFGIDPKDVKPPVDADHIDRLKEYSKWLFGDAETPPVVQDSREVDKFARVIASTEGLDYLRSVRRPSLEKAFVIAGGDQEEVYELLTTATYNLQESLSSIHLYKNDERLITISKRLLANADQLRKTLELN
nr:hypothetical protein [Brucella intermedia]